MYNRNYIKSKLLTILKYGTLITLFKLWSTKLKVHKTGVRKNEARLYLNKILKLAKNIMPNRRQNILICSLFILYLIYLSNNLKKELNLRFSFFLI